ncbi:MAG: peroxidase [Luteitalea sp.]|nr:peroxidase [Luteitalea sp.]
MAEVPLHDVQGFVMRTYAMPALRVFVLEVMSPEPAARFLSSIVSGDPSTPQLTSATPWSVKPDYCVNIGFTHAGLTAMRLPASSLDSFPEEFVQGAVRRAEIVGDTNGSAPAHWKGRLADDDTVHALLFVFAQSREILENVSAALRAGFDAGSAFREVSVQDAEALPGNVAHFGYRDGFAQPTIEGGLPAATPDVLPKAPAGEFLLGYPSQYSGFTYPVPEPADQLGHNGSFVAFRILEQDCDGFEAFLKSASEQTGLDPELVAAKICGRWRNGVPLALAPDTPDVDLPLDKYNSFDYVPTPEVPDAHDDRRGYRCPIGAHIRRMNPRHSMVAGNSGLKRRIVRRGLPYGPPYDPAHPGDGIERGLLGLFIGVSLKDQFEFLMSDWANKGVFAPGLRDTRDPVLGDNSSPDAKFLLPVEGQKPIELVGLSRFVSCRGAAYCFLPSVGGIKYLSQIHS